ncbi:hypothetical protein SUGI_0183730 [Cryptomeria japonica]|nr:hypothetical protein SUGI_0183730 [Cryptomeria japonica]
MVCQAASQTRFRALKHECGVAGNATIVVRVIACFQPLQDCQAEYFRQLLKPVTKNGWDNAVTLLKLELEILYIINVCNLRALEYILAAEDCHFLLISTRNCFI